MNKKLVSALLTASFMAAVSSPVWAADSGKVNFAGKIVADTCVVNVDGAGAAESTVTFDDTYPTDYAGDGTTGTSKAFKIELTKCDPLIAKLNLRFSGNTSDGAKKRLLNELTGAGNATNVGITVKNENGTKGDVIFDGSIPDSGTDVSNDAAGEAASVFNYTASVIQIGASAPTAGQYASSATFEVFYR